MGMPFPKLPAHLFDPALQPFIERLNAWGRDTDRFQKSVTTPAETPSPTPTLSLMPEPFVQPTRIVGGVSAFSLSGITGNLIPATDNTFDIGENSTPLRWRDLWLARNADINGTLDVLGGVTVTGHARFASGISTTGLSLSGLLVATSPAVTHEIRGQVRGYSQFFILSDGSNTDLALNLGALFGTHGLTSLGRAEFGSHVQDFSTHAVDGALGVTGLATFSGGVSAASGFTFTGAVATIQNLTVSNGLTGSFATFSNNLRVDGAFGVTGQALMTGGVQGSGGVTFTGTVQLPGGIGTVGITGNPAPITNLTQSLGTTGKRWGNVFGGTLTLTSAATVGGTLTVTGDFAHQIASVGGVQVTTIGNSLNVAGQFSTDGGFNADTRPAADDAYNFGTANLRWNRMFLSGAAVTAMGATITAGTTLALGGGGNYYHISGVSSIAGISTADSATTGTYQAGMRVLFNLNSNPTFLHSSRIILNGSTDYVGATGAMIEFVSEGADNWREVTPRGRT